MWNHSLNQYLGQKKTKQNKKEIKKKVRERYTKNFEKKNGLMRSFCILSIESCAIFLLEIVIYLIV